MRIELILLAVALVLTGASYAAPTAAALFGMINGVVLCAMAAVAAPPFAVIFVKRKVLRLKKRRHNARLLGGVVTLYLYTTLLVGGCYFVAAAALLVRAKNTLRGDPTTEDLGNYLLATWQLWWADAAMAVTSSAVAAILLD